LISLDKNIDIVAKINSNFVKVALVNTPYLRKVLRLKVSDQHKIVSTKDF